MAAGLLNLGYEVGYLLKMSPYFSPAHHISGVVLVRDDGSRAVCPSLLCPAAQCHLLQLCAWTNSQICTLARLLGHEATLVTLARHVRSAHQKVSGLSIKENASSVLFLYLIVFNCLNHMA